MFTGIFFCCQPATLAQSKFTSTISVCNLPVPSSIKVPYANFSISYSFELKSDGSPTNVKKIVDKYIGQEAVSACISNWKFSDISDDKKLVAMFRWIHGKGWVELVIVGSKVSYSIKVKEGIGY